MKRIALYLDWPDRYVFFRRLLPGLHELGWRGVFFTNKLALYRRARRDGVEALLLRAPAGGGAPAGSLEATAQRVSGILTAAEAQRLFLSARDALEALWKAGGIDAVLIWNGDCVVGQTVRDFARRRTVDTLFLEVANLPGKLFADPWGVNASSRLAAEPALLDELPLERERFRRWREAFLEEKDRRHVVPQAGTVRRVDYRSTFLNHLGFLLLRLPTDDRRSMLEKLWAMKLTRPTAPGPGEAPPAAGSYVFFPMQVSHDTQLLLNSDVGNEEAVRIAARRAAELGCELLVKPHPAEPEAGPARKLLERRGELGFSVTGGNTFHLIRGARRVITINSSVGLEALLCGREVEFLGRSFYPHLDSEERLARYVCGYLLDVEYFAAAPVPGEQIARLLRRLAPPGPTAGEATR